MGGPVEVLQRFHTLVSRARRRVAVVQDGLHQVLAFWIVSAQSCASCNFSGVSSEVIARLPATEICELTCRTCKRDDTC